MDMFLVNGGKPLFGEVAVSGAKNAALPMMAAAILAEGPTTLRNIPELVDVATLAALLRSLGLDVDRPADDTSAVRLEVTDSAPCVADYDLVCRMRAGVCVLGPLLARRGRARVSLPGGCNIGDRPIDLHLKGLRALGADIRVERGYVVAEAARLRGANVFLGGPFGSTVTGTCNVMAAATLAEGVTTIESAACEPEVVDLGNCLNAMGAKVQGLGTPLLTVEGVDRLQGVEHSVIPDRIEAATLMIAAAITGGEITIHSVPLSHMSAVVEKLKEVGVAIRNPGCENRSSNSIRVSVPDRLRATDVVALPYPGIPTDAQAQFMALLTLADGISVVTDKVFPDRFMHAAELGRLGARIRRESATAVVSGVDRLSGACVMASDLRASAALVLAALAADGPSVVRRIYHLDRGYDRLDEKLNRLGADIHRVKDCPENMPESLSDPAATSLAGPQWLRRRRTRSRRSA